MADREFKTIIGFVQFDVEERDINGQTARDVTVRASGSEGPLVRITVWEEFSDAPIEKGDLVAVDGPFEARYVDGRTDPYLNLSASTLNVNGTRYEKAERKTTSKSKTKKKF